MFCFQVVAAIYLAQSVVPALVLMKQETVAHVVVLMVTVEDHWVNVMTALMAGIGHQVTALVPVSTFSQLN